MLDLNYVREHLDLIEAMGRDRGIGLDLGPFRALDMERRALITSAERLKAERNKASEGIARMKKAGEDASAILALMKEVSDKIKQDDLRINELDERAEEFFADDSEYAACERAGGQVRGGQCGSAAVGRAAGV